MNSKAAEEFYRKEYPKVEQISYLDSVIIGLMDKFHESKIDKAHEKVYNPEYFDENTTDVMKVEPGFANGASWGMEHFEQELKK